MKYLLDTNICIYYMLGKHNLGIKFASLPQNSLYISEITLAELKFGVANSNRKRQNAKVLDNFLSGIAILPIIDSLDLYAKEKARLRKQGQPVDDFDLLIGCTAISQGMTLVTNNIKHFERLSNIQMENWVE